MLTLENVSLNYGSFKALDGVTLHAKQGELVVLLGANGAGKSSIFLTISGIHRAAGGSIQYDGQQQMVAIGRALMGRPKMLLLDEPSLGLAPLVIKQTFEVIQRINQAGTTVLLAEQNAFAALKIAHRAYVLENGRIVMEGDPESLLHNDEVRRAYIGA